MVQFFLRVTNSHRNNLIYKTQYYILTNNPARLTKANQLENKITIDTNEKLDKTRQNRNKGGRPSKKEQAEMEVKLRPFFDMNMTALFVSTQPGMPNIHTVTRIFSKWANQLLDSYDYGHVDERQVLAKIKLTNAFQRLLFKLEYQLNRFENIIEEDREAQTLARINVGSEGRIDDVKPYTPNMMWEYMYKKLVESIAELQDAIAANESVPTVWEQSEDFVRKRLQAKRDKFWESYSQKGKKKMPELI